MNKWTQRIIAVATIASAMATIPVTFAQTYSGQMGGYGNHQWQPKPGMAFGQITAINGDILTVQGKNGTNYTVDATSATVTINGQTSSLSSLAVGNKIMVQGQPNSSDNTQITAQTIREGMMGNGANGGTGMGMGRFGGKMGGKFGRGHGKMGQGMGNQGQTFTVTAINGTSISANSSTGTAYTIDMSNAKIVRLHGAVSAISEIAVGDQIRVFGPAPTSGTTTLAPTNVRDLSIQENASLVGTVQSNSGTSLTIQSSDGSIYTVNTTSTTQYKSNFPNQYPISSLGNIVVGDQVRVFGLLNSNLKTDSALAIRLMNRNGAVAQ